MMLSWDAQLIDLGGLVLRCSMQEKESPDEASAETLKAAGAMLLEAMLLSVSGAAAYPEAPDCHVC